MKVLPVDKLSNVYPMFMEILLTLRLLPGVLYTVKYHTCNYSTVETALTESIYPQLPEMGVSVAGCEAEFLQKYSRDWGNKIII